MTFSTPHIGDSRHGLFFTKLDCQSNAKASEKDHNFPEFEPGTFGVAVSDPTTKPFLSLSLLIMQIISFLLSCEKKLDMK
jgi:hypothetical protein